MTTIHRPALTRLIVALLLVGAMQAPAAAAADLVVLVNAGRHETNLSLQLLTRIFRGESRYWPNRQNILVVLPPVRSSKTLDAFIKSLLNLDPARYDTYWEEKRFRGEVTALPLRASDDAATLHQLESSSNAIALMEFDRFEALPKGPGVRVLQIDGKNPGQPGYPVSVKP